MEKYQCHCLRLKYPELEHTEDRLAASQLDDLTVKLDTQCLDYVSIIYNEKRLEHRKNEMEI